DAERPRVPRRDPAPGVRPRRTRVVGAEHAGVALDLLGDTIDAPVARRREEYRRLRRMRDHHVDVGVVAGKVETPAGAAVPRADDAADFHADPHALRIDVIDDERAGPSRLARLDRHA